MSKVSIRYSANNPNGSWTKICSAPRAIAVGKIEEQGKASLKFPQVQPGPGDFGFVPKLAPGHDSPRNTSETSALIGPGDAGFVPQLAPGYNSPRKTDKTYFSPKIK